MESETPEHQEELFFQKIKIWPMWPLPIKKVLILISVSAEFWDFNARQMSFCNLKNFEKCNPYQHSIFFVEIKKYSKIDIKFQRTLNS